MSCRSTSVSSSVSSSVSTLIVLVVEFTCRGVQEGGGGEVSLTTGSLFVGSDS